MTRRHIQQFIRQLEHALAAVERKDTGCETAPDRCWRCAMRYKTERLFNHALVDAATGQVMPDQDSSSWSFGRPREHTIAMFRNSIEALRRSI